MGTGCNKVLWTIDAETDAHTFERLCVDLLCREGYRNIIAVGGVRDHGRDAEVRAWTGHHEIVIPLAFQFSKEEDWEGKLRRDAVTIAKHCPTAKGLVFVTSRTVSGEKQDKLRTEFKEQYNWTLCIYGREWLRHLIEEVHQDLAKRYLDLDLPETVCHAETLIDIHGLDEESAKEIFRSTTPHKVKAVILARTEKQPNDAEAWKHLALIEYHLRDYDAALKAALSALRIKPENVNLKLLRAVILAENGIRKRSRVLLMQAKEVFAWAAQKLDRAVDHYNLANVLGPLGERDTAEDHYRRCIEKNPDSPQAWKNLGSLLFQKGQHREEMKCYARALALKPDLVEAHLCKGITFLVALNKPDEAIRCFEAAYKLDPDLDRKWGHARYWYGAALFALKRPAEALVQVDAGLSLVLDNPYLLNLKAVLLSHLWQSDTAHQKTALEFFKFRVSLKQTDFASLDELIQLLTRCGVPEDAWPFIDANLDCSPFSVRDIAERAGIAIDRLRVGFAAASAYRPFRDKFRVDDYFVTMREYGLTPWPIMEKALGVVLMVPFGDLHQAVAAVVRSGQVEGLKTVFENALADVSRIFPAFGAHWLSPDKPTTKERWVDLLSVGVAYLPDVIVAEVSRQFGYCTGSSGIPPDLIPDMGRNDWRDVRSAVGSLLLENVAKDWGLFATR